MAHRTLNVVQEVIKSYNVSFGCHSLQSSFQIFDINSLHSGASKNVDSL